MFLMKVESYKEVNVMPNPRIGLRQWQDWTAAEKASCYEHFGVGCTRPATACDTVRCVENWQAGLDSSKAGALAKRGVLPARTSLYDCDSDASWLRGL
mmetsp:Transcript_69605/g.163468  ORF Transcript_69605/g.163468 Transcript_69605/m.163468 type:complete len:98 (-) Transcript_69605:93-386(-)